MKRFFKMSFPSGYRAETGTFFTAGGEELELEDTLPLPSGPPVNLELFDCLVILMKAPFPGVRLRGTLAV